MTARMVPEHRRYTRPQKSDYRRRLRSREHPRLSASTYFPPAVSSQEEKKEGETDE